MTKVYVIDFDNTFADERTYRGIWDEIESKTFTKYDEKAITDYVISNCKVLGNTDAWLSAIEHAIAHGDKIAFASFTEFGYVIKPFIKAKLGLSNEALDQIIVEAGPPVDENNKNQHITNILAKIEQENIDPKDVTLIDDVILNISAARRKNYSTIYATYGGQYAESLYGKVTGKSWTSKVKVGDMVGRQFGPPGGHSEGTPLINAGTHSRDHCCKIL